MMKTLATLVVLAFASVAIAQTVTDQYKREQKPRVWQADQVMEQRLLVDKLLTADGGCVGCQTGIASGTWDFPALGCNPVDTQCAESATLAVTGATFEDGCSASSNLGEDGGAALASYAHLSCRAVSGGAVFQLCVFLTDGGSYNLGDAGFTARTSR